MQPFPKSNSLWQSIQGYFHVILALDQSSRVLNFKTMATPRLRKHQDNNCVICGHRRHLRVVSGGS